MKWGSYIEREGVGVLQLTTYKHMCLLDLGERLWGIFYFYFYFLYFCFWPIVYGINEYFFKKKLKFIEQSIIYYDVRAGRPHSLRGSLNSHARESVTVLIK